MSGNPLVSTSIVESFMERVPGGAFIYRASEGHEILFANHTMVRLFECDDFQDFMDFVKGSFDGIVNESSLDDIQKDIDQQIEKSAGQFDHVFYKIKTKKGNVRFLEDYGALVRDPQEGDIFYVFVVEHPIEKQHMEYVVENFDAALRNGWIQVYYQPVVRTLTGKLCGAESLARWIDPDLGMISPDNFVPALEKNNLIHKLDSFVVEQVCKNIRERLDTGGQIVPVSVNLSRLDFLLCDMVHVLEQATKKYDIPREYIHIEVTESMIVSDHELMQNVMRRFRKAGFEIWMDDFGSGYSSMTLLKDYQFDLLKFDMNFLRPFTEKAKDIMRSAVIMVKNIGVKTLAEGVETQEQMEFLKEIGCGKIQGYYCGKPMPIQQFIEKLDEIGIEVEKAEWYDYYDIASFLAKYTEMPYELVEEDGDRFSTLFMNEAYKEQIGMQDMSIQEIDQLIYHTPTPLLAKYRAITKRMKQNRREERFYYSVNGSYFFFKGKIVAEKDGRSLIEGSLYNLGKEGTGSESDKLDEKLRDLSHLFEVVVLLDTKRDEVIPILGRYAYQEYDESDFKGINRSAEVFAKRSVHQEDAKKYVDFLNLSTLKKRIARSENGYISQVFWVKQADGTYKKKEITLMAIGDTRATEYLFCLKDYTES
jgi:EAL domain-containing protein (putative c-di-GMP-specific phosphodiesterase class I)